MTPNQTLAVAAIGGLAALLGLAVFTALAIGLYTIANHAIGAHEELSERLRRARAHRKQLADYRRELNTLPTTPHPTKDHRT